MDRSAEGILKYLIGLLECCLTELNGAEANPFSLGEKYAYAECLETIKEWEKAAECGLGYDVEKKFPL